MSAAYLSFSHSSYHYLLLKNVCYFTCLSILSSNKDIKYKKCLDINFFLNACTRTGAGVSEDKEHKLKKKKGKKLLSMKKMFDSSSN